MSDLPLFATLAADGLPLLTLSGEVAAGPQDGLWITDAGIEGWLSAPDAKVDLIERQTGDGAHDVDEGNIRYAARTVTLHWLAGGSSRHAVLAGVARVSAFTHRMVRLRVVDDGQDTEAVGFVRPEMEPVWREHGLAGTLTIVCPRPERLSSLVRKITLIPSALSGGLSYGPDAAGLVYPLAYGMAGSAQNTGSVLNAGTSMAQPIITVTGPFPSGVVLDWGGRRLAFDAPVGFTPLVLDCRSKTAKIGELDVSRQLSQRAFPQIPPGGTVTVSLMSAGAGWVTIESHDTYM